MLVNGIKLYQMHDDHFRDLVTNPVKMPHKQSKSDFDLVKASEAHLSWKIVAAASVGFS